MLTLLLATLLLPLAIGAACYGARLLIKGIREADRPSGPLCLVRGIRAVTIAVALGALSGGLTFASAGLVWFGAVFLTEELYETGVVLLILRAGLRAEASMFQGETAPFSTGTHRCRARYRLKGSERR